MRIPMGFDADDGDSSARVVALTFKQARFTTRETPARTGSRHGLGQRHRAREVH